MDFRQLTALVAVADCGSVTKAARLLRLAQPAVSRQIQLLEEELGVRLFDRTRGGMAATPAGELLLERARRVLTELERARAEVRVDHRRIAGIVTVGVLESLADMVVPGLVDTVARSFPDIELRVLTAYSGHLRRWLDDGDIDLSFLYNLIAPGAWAVVPLVEERLWAVGPPSVGLDPVRPVAWQEVLTHPLVLPAAGHGLRILIDQALAKLQVQTDVSVQTNSMYLQKRLVLDGHGWTIPPAAGAAADVAAGRLSGSPLIEPGVHRAVALAVRRGARVSAAVDAVAVAATGIVRRQARSGAWPTVTLLGEATRGSAEAMP